MREFRLERGPVPLHYQVYVDLDSAISSGEWRPGDRLPTERDLAGRYGCSLITVRRALDELAREGRLERTRGRGTFITTPPIVRDIGGPSGFADEIRALGYKPYSLVVTAVDEPASVGVARALGIEPGEPVHYLERLRGADGSPLLLEQVRLPVAMSPGLLEQDLGGDRSLWEVLRTEFDMPVTRWQEVVSAVLPTSREAGLLGLRSRRPSVQFEGVAFTTGDRPIESSRTVVSPDRARYFVESGEKPGRRVTPVAST